VRSEKIQPDALGNDARANEVEPHGASVGYSTFIRCSFWTARPAGLGFRLSRPRAPLWQQRNQYAMFKQFLSRPNFVSTKAGGND
jgi:hypothetical protein